MVYDVRCWMGLVMWGGGWGSWSGGLSGRAQAGHGVDRWENRWTNYCSWGQVLIWVSSPRQAVATSCGVSQPICQSLPMTREIYDPAHKSSHPDPYCTPTNPQTCRFRRDMLAACLTTKHLLLAWWQGWLSYRTCERRHDIYSLSMIDPPTLPALPSPP